MYDGDGKRIKKIQGGTTTLYVYNAFGNLIAEYSDHPSSSGGTTYLTTDHLGSTRVVTDASKQVKSRHDYLPFGDEISSGYGNRSTITGYNAQGGIANLNLKQKFTAKERDTESNLDYFLARYLSGAQGRFISVDPLLSSGKIYDPQSWNRYTYTLNNPLKYVDPLGLFVWGTAAGGEATDDELRRRSRNRNLSRADQNGAKDALKFRTNFRNALDRTTNTANALNDGADRDQVAAAVNAYGAEGTANGVTVTSGTLANGIVGQVAADPNQPLSYSNGTFTANVTVTIDPNNVGAITVGHEGTHVADRQAFAAAVSTDPNALNGPFNITRYQTEFNAYTVSSSIARGLGLPNLNVGGNELWNSGWRAADIQTLRSNGINQHLRTSPTYGLTPQNPGTFLYPRQ